MVIGVGVHLGDELDGADTNGGVAGDPQGAASVKLTVRVEPGAADIDAECGGHASHGDAGAGQQGLRSMSPEQASLPSPPVAGWSPARTGPAHDSTVQVMPGSSNDPDACNGVSALAGSSRYRRLSGACISRKVLRSMSDLSENPGPTEPEYCQ